MVKQPSSNICAHLLFMNMYLLYVQAHPSGDREAEVCTHTVFLAHKDATKITTQKNHQDQKQEDPKLNPK